MRTRFLFPLLLGATMCSSSGSAPGGGGTQGGAGGSGGTGGGGANNTGGGTSGSGAGGNAPGGGGSSSGASGTGGTGLGSGDSAAGGSGPAGGTGGSAGAGGATGAGGVDAGGTGAGGTGPGRLDGGGTGGTASSGDGGPPLSTFAVVTNRYDNARSGSNLQETILNTTNVNRNTFGLLFSRTIAGRVYGQPLYVGGLTINGVKRNVVYVATQHNMIYAFDADAPAPDAPLWSKMLGTPLTLGAGANYNPGCTDMQLEVGITSTPVISLADNKIFLVAKTSTDQQLHSLDLATGAETAGSPITISPTAMPVFDPQIHLSRAGLLLQNGTVYIAYSSHCDAGAYHGWVFGYDAQTLQLRTVYNPTPTGTQGSIWQSGIGPASDGTSIWACVGNGTTGGQNMGNNVLRLTPAGTGLTIAAHYQARVSGDNDLQSGVILLGNTGQVVAGGKDGDILLLNQSDLALRTTVPLGGELNSFVFWQGSAGPMLYVWPVAGPLHSYQVGAGTLTDRGSNAERQPGHPSGIFTISSNGATAGTGIVWASVPLIGDAWHATATGGLYAFDAANVARASLWNSNLVAADNLGTFAKYSPPIVANGKVYVANFAGKLQVYGLK